ncbi:hypothetical protein VP01_3763g3 [Puccinia sorghi]|uniref:Uncharacterized protein n=1 Tax=Puccinia sorghi TaxID=27349 RepID=A0A0L6UVP3_9BASI|nr:hypothetical protein VP01_3763g3 [Puccinia sorghi]
MCIHFLDRYKGAPLYQKRKCIGEVLIEKVISSNIYCSVSLDEHENLICHILRLMNLSVNFPIFVFFLGPLVMIMIFQVGNGPPVGYLIMIGKARMNVERSSCDTCGGEINLITGRYWKIEKFRKCAERFLSDSKKEPQVEWLCGLFD